MSDQGDGEVGDLLVAEADQIGGVLAVVVADDHFFDLAADLRRGSGRGPWPGSIAALYATTRTPILFFSAPAMLQCSLDSSRQRARSVFLHRRLM